MLSDEKAKTRVIVASQLFQTPEPLADRMASMLTRFGRVLEPSAGLGRLYRAVRKLDPACPVVLVDNSPECCGELYRATEGDGNARLIAGDFLTMDAERLGGAFDSIIMNPPFRMGTDIRHILRACELLTSDGVLVSVCADGPRQRKILRPIAETWEPLPSGSFRSEGTDVATAVIRITRESCRKVQ